jgi:hypothetical protein
MAEVITGKVQKTNIGENEEFVMSQTDVEEGRDPDLIMAEAKANSESMQITRAQTTFTDSLAECAFGGLLVALSLYMMCKNERKQVLADNLLTHVKQQV